MEHNFSKVFDIDRMMSQTAIRQVEFFPSITSTNDYAKTLLATREMTGLEPLLILADVQTGGRGRGVHRWWSPTGSLAMTLLTTWSRYQLDRHQCFELSFHLANAVCRTVEAALANLEYKGDPPTVKPPNDVLVGGRKIAGILTESPNPQWVIAGIGLGINNRAEDSPEELRDRITTIHSLTGQYVDPTSFCIELVNRILEN